MCDLITEFYDQPNTTLDKFILHTSISSRMEIYHQKQWLQKIKNTIRTFWGQESLPVASYHQTVWAKLKEANNVKQIDFN
jgi:hypothetical protein